MDNSENRKPDWQTSLEHHESLCSERYEAIHRDIGSLRNELKDFKDEMRSNLTAMGDDIRELRIGQRWIIGAMLMWPPLMIAALKLL